MRCRATSSRSDEGDLAIVRSTINLGHDLGMKVVGEGVEDDETYGALRAATARMAS